MTTLREMSPTVMISRISWLSHPLRSVGTVLLVLFKSRCKTISFCCGLWECDREVKRSAKSPLASQTHSRQHSTTDSTEGDDGIGSGRSGCGSGSRRSGARSKLRMTLLLVLLRPAPAQLGTDTTVSHSNAAALLAWCDANPQARMLTHLRRAIST
jgi:hypothetical protein